MIRIPAINYLPFIIFGLVAITAWSQNETTFKHKEIDNFLKLPSTIPLGTPPSLDFDNQLNLVILQRKSAKSVISPGGLVQNDLVLILDPSNYNLIESWGKNTFKKPHGIHIDDMNNIWITDTELQQVFKFSHEGKLLMKLGIKNIPGNDSLHFDQPTDVTVGKDGSFYVTDGYGNDRVVKFSASGKYLFEWGSKGNAPRQFNLPHAIDIDLDGNLYVADRENNRIQMFDSNGNFIRLWTDESFGAIQSLRIDKKNNILYAVDYKIKKDGDPLGSDIIIVNIKSGKFQKIEDSNKIPVRRYHDIGFDTSRNLYTADILLNKIHKFNLKR
jgi:peptidylamidoglycolate lyase